MPLRVPPYNITRYTAELWKAQEMTDNLEMFLQEVQQDVDEEVRKYYGEAFYQRWRTPPNFGELENAAMGEQTGTCGDTIRIYLLFTEGRVHQATFWTNGCASSTVSASMAAEMASGKTEDELMELSGEAVLQAIGTMPEDDAHCAFLAANAVHAALEDHRSNK